MMRAGDGKQCIYLEWPNIEILNNELFLLE